MCKIVVLLIKPIVFAAFPFPSPDLKVPNEVSVVNIVDVVMQLVQSVYSL